MPDASPATTNPHRLDVGLFNVLWGIGLLLHFTWPGPHIYVQSPTGYASVVTAAMLIVRPRSPAIWTFAALTQLSEAAYTATTIDRLSMSWMIMGVFHLVLLHGLWKERGRPAAERCQAVLDGAAPALRWLVVGIYFYATLHKLNTAYFADSNHRSLQFLGRIHPLINPEDFLTRTQASTLGVVAEGLIFAFLFIPRTRLLAVLMSVALHFTLGFAGFQQFAIMFPMGLLFLRSVPHPSGPARRLMDRLPAWSGRAAWLLVPAVVAFLTWGETIARNPRVRDSWWLVLGAFMAFEIARRVRAHGLGSIGDVPLFDLRLRDAVAPALFALWCFVPYFGVTSHPCMTMYSRLAVHSGTSNHLFIPAGLQIDAIQGDLVEITASSSPDFPVGGMVPRLALRKAIRTAVGRGKAPAEVEWREDGRTVTARDGELPSPSILDDLPMISFAGPVALGRAKQDARRRRAPPRAPIEKRNSK